MGFERSLPFQLYLEIVLQKLLQEYSLLHQILCEIRRFLAQQPSTMRIFIVSVSEAGKEIIILK